MSATAIACPPESESQNAAPRQTDSAPVAAKPAKPWLDIKSMDPNDPAVKAYAAAQKTRVATERELKKIRAKYFNGIRNAEIRQVGISKLRAYTDPALFPSLITTFAHDEQDVRGAILDHLMDQKSDEGDATLAWESVFSTDDWQREQAGKRLLKRIGGKDNEGEVSSRIQSVIAMGLRSERNTTVGAAAQLANVLKLFDAIPMLINAQVVGSTGSGNGEDEGALAYILVGTQQAFVADLTPVVGDNAVAFDPTLGVVTSGVYLRVIDAVVVTYRTEVHNALIALSSAGWGGQSTAPLGWDGKAWREWYAKEFVPYRAQVAAQQLAAKTPK